MRDLKFRYLWKGDWYYIDLYNDNTRAKFEAYESVNKTSQFYQYTGLKDKNGKEIYEGDVVKPFSDEDYAEIIFMDGAFKVATKTKKGSYLIWNYLKTEIEVVGNIHEDKDILK